MEQNIQISFRTEPRNTVCLVSGTTVREEALQDTRLTGLYWSAGGQVQREDVTDTLPLLNPGDNPVHVFDLEIDGQDLRNRWDWVSGTERNGKKPGTREAVIELRHQVRSVSVKVITRLDGTPFIVRYLEITNTGDKPAAISNVSSLSGLLWHSVGGWGGAADGMAELASYKNQPYSLGYFDSTTAGREGNLVFEPLPDGTRRIEGRTGDSGFGGPFFFLKNELTGETAMGGLAWSGNWYAEFWSDPRKGMKGNRDYINGYKLGFSMGPLGPAPLRVIEPGETVISPETHTALLHLDTDGCINAMHDHMRTSVIPPRPEGKEMYVTAGRVVEQPGEWMFKEIEIAAELGFEAFMVDAGWYGEEFRAWPENRGDWFEGDWIPGGLAACRKKCHENNMLFGLWMEPEIIGGQSRLLKEHPEWVLKSDKDRIIGGALDLSNPEAQEFFTESIKRVIRENKLDFFKIDRNMQLGEGGQGEKDGYLEHETWRHMEVLYRTFDEVRDEFPDLALENCASGGRRNDLGMLSRFHYTVESDFSTFPHSIRAINGLSLFIPPESINYYHNHMSNAHFKADLDTHLRVFLFCQTMFVGFGSQDADRNTEYFRKTKRYVELAKIFTEPILKSHPNVFHHTPFIGVFGETDWCVLEYARLDKSEAYAGIFRVGDQGGDEYLFRPRGINMSRRYDVTFDNSCQTAVISGRELALTGLPVRLDTRNTSELIMLKEH